jgi:hypothetical protein
MRVERRVIDPSAFAEKGTESVKVQRQCNGRAEKIDHCQVGVYLGYVRFSRFVIWKSSLILDISIDKTGRKGFNREWQWSARPRSPGSARERAAWQAPLPCVFIDQVARIRGRASRAVRSRAEPGNEANATHVGSCRGRI